MNKYAKDINRFVASGDFEQTDTGVLIHSAIMLRGKYICSSNGGQDPFVSYNLIPTEGINHLLNVCLGTASKVSNWYIALFGNATPAPTWTAATFPAVASEIVSGTEGYSNMFRPVWSPSAAANGVISNASSRAQFNIVTASTLDIYGAALLSSQTKGGTSGVLISASRYPAKRVQSNGDIFEVVYEVELIDT